MTGARGFCHPLRYCLSVPVRRVRRLACPSSRRGRGGVRIHIFLPRFNRSTDEKSRNPPDARALHRYAGNAAQTPQNQHFSSFLTCPPTPRCRAMRHALRCQPERAARCRLLGATDADRRAHGHAALCRAVYFVPFQRSGRYHPVASISWTFPRRASGFRLLKTQI